MALHFIFSLVLLVDLCGPAGARGLEEFRRAASPVIPAVRTIDSRGCEKLASGVFISPTGYFICTQHVLSQARDIFVKCPGWKSEKKAVLIMQDPETHLALLKIQARGVNAQPFLGLLPTRPARGSACLILSCDDSAQAGRYMKRHILGPLVDPWQAAALPMRTKYGMRAWRLLKPFPLHATGAPCFSEDGRVIGIASFFHNFSAPDGTVRFVYFIVPAAYLRDLICCACIEEVKRLHGDSVRGLLRVLNAAERGLSLSERIVRRRRRRVMVDRILEQADRQKKTEFRSCARAAARVEQSFRALPDDVKRLGDEHPDWSYRVLRAIAQGRPFPGMTAEQVVSMQGPPRKIVKEAEITRDGRRLDVWMYDRTQLLSFDKNDILVRIR